MSYAVKSFLEYVHGHHSTQPRIAQQTTWASGPHPNLKPVWRRHPAWKRRLKAMYADERGSK